MLQTKGGERDRRLKAESNPVEEWKVTALKETGPTDEAEGRRQVREIGADLGSGQLGCGHRREYPYS